MFITEGLPISSLQVGNGTVDNATASQLAGATNLKVYNGVQIWNISGAALYIKGDSNVTAGSSFKLSIGKSAFFPVDNIKALWLLSSGADVSYSWRAI